LATDSQTAEAVIVYPTDQLRELLESVARDETLPLDTRHRELEMMEAELSGLVNTATELRGTLVRRDEAESINVHRQVMAARENADIREAMLKRGLASEQQLDDLGLLSHGKLDELEDTGRLSTELQEGRLGGAIRGFGLGLLSGDLFNRRVQRNRRGEFTDLPDRPESVGPAPERPQAPQRPRAPEAPVTPPSEEELRRQFHNALDGVPGQLEPHDFEDLDELYERSEANHEDFTRLAGEITAALGGGQASFDSELDYGDNVRQIAAAARSGPQAVVPPLKKRETAAQKVEVEYGGDVRQLGDVLRGSIIAGRAAEMPEVLQRLRAQLSGEGWRITRAKQRTVKIEDEDHSPGPIGGYRDVLIQLRAPDGTPAELQIHAGPLWQAKEAEGGHDIYVQEREITQRFSRPIEDLSDEERERLNELRRLAERLYADSWQRAVVGTSYNE
jgi:hypothetical protein